jgi:paraquat-inducible protein B
MPDQPQSPIRSARVAEKRRGISLVWIIPIVAAAVGVWVAVTRILSQGPVITLQFDSAEGLEAGKTKIHYKGVDVGTLNTIRLSDNHKYVVATAQMAPKTEDFLVEDTEFWVVRPRISGANVSGLGTLISGSFVGMEIGHSRESKRDFVALETPPVVTGGEPGRTFQLKTPNLGSLDIGTPMFFRHLQVGEVAGYTLDADGQAFTLKVFVKAPYDQYVTSNTRFWQASGIDVQLSASGLKVQTQSLLSILVGGIAFETPANGPVLPAADQNTIFTLFDDRQLAFAPAAHNPQTYQLIFNESVAGLSPGAPVEFRGIQIGQVTDIHAQIDVQNFKYSVPVTIQLDPQRLGVRIEDLRAGASLASVRHLLIDSLVAHGVRAQLKTANLLTGAALVSFDFFPNAAPVKVDWSQDPVQLPTTPGQLEATEARLEGIVDKIDTLPLGEMSDNINKVLTSLDLTLVSARGTLASTQTTMDNANNIVEPNSIEGQQIDNTLREVSRAARSVRVLADYLEQHPDSLLRGKSGGPK